MTIQNMEPTCTIGMVGLGVMGRNLLLNMADHGFPVAGYDIDRKKVEALRTEAKEQNIYGADTTFKFIALLRKPRTVMLLVPAGRPVDLAISDLLPHLTPGDLIIDGGNSHFTDTNKRFEHLQKKGIQFLGVGISGGEEGARQGPSIMPGGSQAAYEQVRPVFEAIAAMVDGQPCTTYLGPKSVGHFVKMVHNGIEYGLMQLIAETYDLMKRGLGLTNEELCDIYHLWNNYNLNSYLIEITSHIFSKVDEKTGKQLIDEIVKVAAQNGTGMWASQSAMELQVPLTLIDESVAMRDLSALIKEREHAGALYIHKRPKQLLNIDRSSFLLKLADALFVGMIIAYAQGMALLAAASKKYQYHLSLEATASIWRGGCIIRSRLLEDIRAAFHLCPHLDNLLLDTTLSQKVSACQGSLRQVVSQAALSGLAIPAFMAALSYLDAYCSALSPANLIQAQRDYFGSHGYERVDTKGFFHTEWPKEQTT